MERHCNTLLPSIRSRRHPYASISTFVTATAQLDQIRLLYDLDEGLCLDPDKKVTDKLIHDLCTFNRLAFISDHSSAKFQTDPLYMLSAPRRDELLSLPIRNKVLACLATRFNVKKDVIQSIIKLDRPITQYGRVTRLEGGDLMIGRDLVQEIEGSRDASFVRVESCLSIYMQLPERHFIQYTQLVDRYARQKRRTPEFELQIFFGQLQRILVLELPSTPRLNLAMPTMIILALIKNVKTTFTDNIYRYKELGVNEVVDLTTVQCVVGRIWDRDEWAIVDRSNNVAIQVD
jgi:hypothetical protein